MWWSYRLYGYCPSKTTLFGNIFSEHFPRYFAALFKTTMYDQLIALLIACHLLRLPET